jgi:dihydromethanopterin reductase
MVDVRVICAIGKQGQLGLNGRLPWEGNPGTEYKADVQRFFALTRGHVVIAGPRTIASFPDRARSRVPGGHGEKEARFFTDVIEAR